MSGFDLINNTSKKSFFQILKQIFKLTKRTKYPNRVQKKKVNCLRNFLQILNYIMIVMPGSEGKVYDSCTDREGTIFIYFDGSLNIFSRRP